MGKLKKRVSFLIFWLCVFIAFASGGCVNQKREETKVPAVATQKESTTDNQQNDQDSREIASETSDGTATMEGNRDSSRIKMEQDLAEVTPEGAEDQGLKEASRKNQVQEAEGSAEENRIIATSAATCEIMNRLGIDLVGVPTTTVSTIASRYDGVTRIGTPMAPDMEIIKTLKPTDVIGPDTLEEDLKMKYDHIGAPSTFLNLKSVKGLYESIELVGKKYGKEEKAAALVDDYNTFMTNYSAKHPVDEKPKVLVLMGLPGSYLVATNQSYAGSLVELAGGVNVFPSDTKDFLNVNAEEILKTDPDIIIRTAHGLPKEALKMFAKEFSENDVWKHFRAVQEEKVYDVDYMIFGMSATFDYPQALSDLEPMLYGEEHE